MGKKLDFLLRRTSRKISKLKTLLGLTVSRLAILRNHRKVRCAQARGDVAQLLQLDHVDRALLRVEHAIKEQNMLDVYVMIEGYCHLVTERAILLEHQKECPEELREAISSLIFAASRCGDLHELQSARYMFASLFGKEFAAAAVELRNSCGVNPKMIQKLSTRQPSLENRQRVTKEIAAEKGIKLDFDEPPPEIPEVDPNYPEQRRNQSQPVVNMSLDTTQEVSELDQDESSSLRRRRQKYKDVASAAQAAYESAAHAAAAARAAVEISRSESQGDDFGGPAKSDGERKTGLYEQTPNIEDETWTGVSDVEKIHPVQSYSSESEEETPAHNKFMPWLERSSSSSSSDPTEAPFQDKKMASNELSSPGPRGKEILFDESEMDVLGRNGRGNQMHSRFDLASDESLSDKQRVSYLQPPYRRNPVRYNMNESLHEEMDQKGWGSKDEDNAAMYYSEAGSRTESVFVDPADKMHMQHSNGGKKAVSVRTRRGF
ncbi:uncharacterized protein [Elaeis guineensis]|uniref:Uncharacterized protein LOC105041064 n=1 Tax=Elaeis guineensis var. tenera TaxID=51953 RepID=A0A6I9QWB0_ELAGV|nr:uncharacterized protein LOC105041064 [Elaeis guineensis]